MSDNFENFSEIIKEWLDIEKFIKDSQRTIKDKKKRQEKLSEYIITFMNKEEKQVCNIGEYGSLHLQNRKSTSTLKKQNVFDLLLKLNEGDNNKTETQINELYNTRKESTKTILKLTVNKD